MVWMFPFHLKHRHSKNTAPLIKVLRHRAEFFRMESDAFFDDVSGYLFVISIGGCLPG